MKNTLFFLFIIVNQLIYSQGNLQFSQVLSPIINITGNITLSGSSSTSLTSSNLIVPTGKVWKVESVLNYYQTPFYCSSCGSIGSNFAFYGIFMKINSNIVQNLTINTQAITNNAIWFKAGDTINFSTNNGNNNYVGTYINGSIIISLSIIEYNIVP